MASNIKKASSVLRKSFRLKRYASFNCKENEIDLTAATLVPKASGLGRERFRSRNMSTSTSSNDENEGNVSTIATSGSPTPSYSQRWLKRGTSMTQSMRDAVGTFKQKLRMSTKRGRLHVTPSTVGTRRHTIGGRQARLNSPFKASTPSRSGRTHIKTCLTKDTPTRLRREVESLTANMEALNSLTPNTMEGRSRLRKSPLTNGSLKAPRTIRRHAVTEIC